jgi:hypothetical protein
VLLETRNPGVRDLSQYGWLRLQLQGSELVQARPLYFYTREHLRLCLSCFGIWQQRASETLVFEWQTIQTYRSLVRTLSAWL